MIDPRPIVALLDLQAHGVVTNAVLEDAIVEIVKATNAELERITRVFFERFGRDYTEQDIAAVLAMPVEVRDRCRGTGQTGHGVCGPRYGCHRPGCPVLG